MRLINAREITELLPMKQAIALMQEAFVAISESQASLAHRQAMPMRAGTGLLMGAAMDGLGLGCKLVAVMPGNQAKGLPGSIGLVALLDDTTGEPLALLDGTSLTSVRTGALNGCAVDLLARPNASVGLLVGCGTQALAQAEAMAAVRELEELRVLGRDSERARAFAALLGDRLSMKVRRVSEAAEALAGVDLITAVTNSLEPVLPGMDIPPGCHVSGVGSFRPDMCEFDLALMGSASIFVESRETAMEEAGELIAAAQAGVSRQRDWVEIGEVLIGQQPGRRGERQVTYFKSVGHSVFDLYAARAIYDQAVAHDVGLAWDP